jgi:hypothetical protein
MTTVYQSALPPLGFFGIDLKKGAHESRDQGVCAMEAAAWLAGEPHSDEPQCACPVIAAFVIAWNDALPTDEDRNRILKPFIPRLVGTKSTEAVEERRSYLALDWLIRVQTPAWLDVREDLRLHAVALRALDPIQCMASAKAANQPVNAARAAARAAAWDEAGAAAGAAAVAAAWDAARGAARAAAGDAARAAAWDAARAAAWAAARAAAGDAARAAAGDAARAAAGAAARDALQPTVTELQTSAADLLERMIAIEEATR